MISLTFVRNSNRSHGTVGRTTGFWSGRYGFESQPSPTFLIITTENLDIPSHLPPSYPKTFSLLEIFWNTAHKGSPTNFFCTARQRIFYRKSWFSPLRHKIFRCPKLSETQKGSSSKFFGNLKQKFSNAKLWYRLAEITEISGGLDVWKLKSKQ